MQTRCSTKQSPRGAQVKMPLANQFWGDRYGKLMDPYGHEWEIATHLEDLTPAEMKKTARSGPAQMAQGPPTNM